MTRGTMRNRLHIKVDLELHSISCPGVWLCPSGYVEITLKTLGYFFKTGPMEPKFPLLAHESFAMEGFFKSVRTLEELEKAIASELIEIAIWQTGRRLAYYKGSLGRILQSVASHTDCVHILRFGSCIQKQIVVQLLMNPSRNFPGVLAPKIEISGRATVRNPGQVYSGYHRDPSEIPLNLPPVEKEEISHEERHNQIKSLKRQRPVCHAKKMSKLATAPGCLQADAQRIDANDEQIPVCILANKIRYGDVTQSVSRSSSHGTSGTCPSLHSHLRTGSASSHYNSSQGFDVSDTEDHSKSCHICQSYISTFSSASRP